MVMLKEVTTAKEPRLTLVPAPFPFERRRSPRRDLNSRAQAVQTHAANGYQLLTLEMQDVSDTGFRALTDKPVIPGSTLRVRLLPRSPMYHATVVRCKPLGGRYELGIRLAQPLAA